MLDDLQQERIDWFIQDLMAASGSTRAKAEHTLEQFAGSPAGAHLLQRVLDECLAGTGRLSLTAMAVLVSMAAADRSDPFPPFAIRALFGGMDDDILAFLALLSRPGSVTDVPSNWNRYFAIEATVALTDEWRDPREVCGIDDEALFLAVSEFVRRRVLLPNTSSTRLPDESAEGLLYFGLSSRTHRFYSLLHRSVRISDPPLIQSLALWEPKVVAVHWRWRLGAARKTEDGSPGSA